MNPNESTNSAIQIGPAGWQYPDWNGTFYPKRKPSGFDALDYITSYFRVVEINSTFYRVPRPETCASWAQRTEHATWFNFTLKAHQQMTHGPILPRPDVIDSFKHAISPLADAGKLDAVLLQFPWSFKDDKTSRLRLEALVTRLSPLPLAIEVRHGDWFRPEGHHFLSSLDTTVCGIDQPVIGNSIKPYLQIVGPAGAYVRFHGRNYDEWFNADTNRDKRYDYSYSEEELRSWMTALRDGAKTGGKVTAIMNNHFRGQAPANAFELMSLLQDGPVAAPHSIRKTYPRLKETTFLREEERATLPMETGSLFDALESTAEQYTQDDNENNG
jgi:uncharacterized protein YecE (DUF72 family)